MTVQSVDTTSAIYYTDDGQALVIEAGVSVAPDLTSAVQSSYAASHLVNRGTLLGFWGVFFDNASTSAFIVNSAEGVIAGSSGGVFLDGLDSTMDNHGEVSGSDRGVALSAAGGKLHNDGVIFGGNTGVSMGESSFLDNEGSISSTGRGLGLGDGVAILATVVNSGQLRGASAAVGLNIAGSALNLTNTGEMIGKIDLETGSASTIVNQGSITGDLVFGAASDAYDGRGGSISGLISGGDGNDKLIAGADDDMIDGGKGNERIKAMDGDDTIIGGLGKDSIWGGRGDDVFLYGRTLDSLPTGFDVIAGWDNGDVIDVSGIDASTTAGFQHLAFGGMVAPGDLLAKGKIQYFQQDGDTFVVADVTGDKVADFEVRIVGAVTLTAADFAV